MSQIPRALEPRRAFWLEHARRSEQSGEPVHVYAAEHELSLKALYRWRGRARRAGMLEAVPGTLSGPEATGGFVRAEFSTAQPGVVRIGLPNGCTVELSARLDRALLAALLRESAAL